MASKPGIPSWQDARASPPPPSAETQRPSEQQPDGESIRTEDGPSGKHDGQSTSELIEQAARFLEDPSIRDAPREKKVEFLQTKGVQQGDIDTLLDRTIPEDATPDLVEAGEKAWATSPPKPVDISRTRSAPRDIPPIVTYPEFLAQPTQQPPLVTTQRLLNTAYFAGGLGAIIYGLATYVVAPMTQNLAESRHDLASHAQQKLDQLNDQLKETASIDPALTVGLRTNDSHDNISEADSDPTELFHRDIATQTSPSLSRRSSLSGSDVVQSVVQTHENRLKSLTAHLEELNAAQSKAQMSNDTLRTRMSELTTYLAETTQQSQYHSTSGGFYASNYGLKNKDGQVDQIEVFKTDIRAVKGVFLSARNFPAGGRNVAPTTARIGT